jgi:hypothetical protein
MMRRLLGWKIATPAQLGFPQAVASRVESNRRAVVVVQRLVLRKEDGLSTYRAQAAASKADPDLHWGVDRKHACVKLSRARGRPANSPLVPCAFHLFVRSGSRRPPQVLVMQSPPTRGTFTTLPLRGSAASLDSDNCVRVPHRTAMPASVPITRVRVPNGPPTSLDMGGFTLAGHALV